MSVRVTIRVTVRVTVRVTIRVTVRVTTGIIALLCGFITHYVLVASVAEIFNPRMVWSILVSSVRFIPSL